MQQCDCRRHVNRDMRSYSMKQDAVVISNYERKYREKWRADNE